jgi:hypothetical protein
MWHWINRAINNPSLGVIPLIQRMEEGKVIDIIITEEMKREIQVVTKQWFDLLMSVPITISSLWE